MCEASLASLSTLRKNAKFTLLIFIGASPFFYLACIWLVEVAYPDLVGWLALSLLSVALIPYALGACIWHLQDRFKKPEKPLTHLVIASVGFLLCGSLLSHWSALVSFFAALPLLGFMTWLLYRSRVKNTAASKNAVFPDIPYLVLLLFWVGNLIVLCLWLLLNANSTSITSNANGLLQTTAKGFALVIITTVFVLAVIAWCFAAPINSRRRKWTSQVSATFFSRDKSQYFKKNNDERHQYLPVISKAHTLQRLSLGEALIASLLILSMTQGIWIAAGMSESILKAALESGFVVLFVLGVVHKLRSGQPLSGIKLILPFTIAILIGLTSGALHGASFYEGLFYTRFLFIPLLFLIGVLNIQLDASAARRLLLLITGLLLLQLPLFGCKWIMFGIEEKHWIGGLSQTAGQLGLIFPMLVLSMLIMVYLYRGGWFILLVLIHSLLPMVNEKRAVMVMVPSLITAAIFSYSRLSSRHFGQTIAIPKITLLKLLSLFIVCVFVWITSIKLIPSLQCNGYESCPLQVLTYGKDYLLRDYSSPMNASATSVDLNTNIQMGRLKFIQRSIEVLADKGWGTLFFGLGGGTVNPSFNIGPNREDILYKKYEVRGTYSYGIMLLWEAGFASILAAAVFFILLWLMLAKKLSKIDTPANLIFGTGIIGMLAVLAFDFFGYSTTGWLTHSVTPLVFILVAIFLRHGYPDKAD